MNYLSRFAVSEFDQNNEYEQIGGGIIIIDKDVQIKEKESSKTL